MEFPIDKKLQLTIETESVVELFNKAFELCSGNKEETIKLLFLSAMVYSSSDNDKNSLEFRNSLLNTYFHNCLFENEIFDDPVVNKYIEDNWINIYLIHYVNELIKINCKDYDYKLNLIILFIDDDGIGKHKLVFKINNLPIEDKEKIINNINKIVDDNLVKILKTNKLIKKSIEIVVGD